MFFLGKFYKLLIISKQIAKQKHRPTIFENVLIIFALILAFLKYSSYGSVEHIFYLNVIAQTFIDHVLLQKCNVVLGMSFHAP